MQKTKFSRINDKFNNLLFGFISSSWKSKSINIISVLTGFFLFANFITKFISEGKNELIMVPIIITIIELIIRLRPSSDSSLFNLWSILDKVRIGATYAVILEAFKLGS
tara:strand:- start:46 stop:372 length:327 start_codon:yes stop_codon:yes gene_type:complete